MCVCVCSVRGRVRVRVCLKINKPFLFIIMHSSVMPECIWTLKSHLNMSECLFSAVWVTECDDQIETIACHNHNLTLMLL